LIRIKYSEFILRGAISEGLNNLDEGQR
jgi:hypothetical protein